MTRDQNLRDEMAGKLEECKDEPVYEASESALVNLYFSYLIDGLNMFGLYGEMFERIEGELSKKPRVRCVEDGGWLFSGYIR
jgi:hypothetical protein